MTTARRAWTLMIGLGAVVVLAGCPRKPVADTKPDAAPPPVTSAIETPEAAPPEVPAANEADVVRYPDELPLDHVLATTHAFSSSARTQASATAGAQVDALKAETDVDEVAEHQGFVLVNFVDPKDPTRKLKGWISQADFNPPTGGVVVHRAALSCAAPQVPVQHAGGETCELPCLRERICPPGMTCTGAGEEIVDGGPGPAVRFCRPTGAGLADAGGSPVAIPARALDVRQEHGMCPGGYARCGAMCRLQCASSAECGSGGHCLQGFCLGSGSVPCAH